MLEVLKIRNFAIIDSAEIHFKSGLNILSGETGAGKSIVIEAISLLLGSRASTELIRAGSDEAVIEGLFRIAEIPWLELRLKNAGFSTDSSELLVKRLVHRAGRHRIFINGELATLTILQNICEGLIDLCGQHEHQSLLKAGTQLELLDRFGGLSDQTRKFSTLWNQSRLLTKEQNELQQKEAERSKRVDFIQFQRDEIRNVNPVLGEDDELHREKQLFQSAATRAQSAESIRQVLESDEGGVLVCLRAALQKLRGLEQLDHQVKSMVESLERGLIETEETGIALQRYLDSIEVNSEKLHSIQDRLSALANLRRKYGSSIEAILASLSELDHEMSTFGEVSDRLGQLQSQLETLQTDLRKIGKKLSHARRKVADLLGTSVTAELKDLKMGEARFSVELSVQEDFEEWNSQGADLIQFQVQTNRGEPARPLGKVASGGELSRLMLAIRRVIADRGGIGVYLFDEIDAGIGGQTAFQVGKKLKSVASYNQVICITHLPQVASFADHHLVVRKSTVGKRTLTAVQELNPSDRKEELARMLAGPRLTRSSLANAAELLELAGAG